MRFPNAKPSHGGQLIAKILVTGCTIYGLQVLYHEVLGAYAAPPEWLVYTYAALVVFAITASVSTAYEVAAIAQRINRRWRALMPGRSLGSAGWLTARQARRAGLGGTKGLFLGILEGQPLFVENAVHGLLCAPSRKGKTTSFVMPALCHDIGCSRLVTDLRADLAAQTAEHIRVHHGHRVEILNPSRRLGLANACYNPLQIIIDDLEHSPEDAMADARSLALQTHRDPPGGARDPYWPNGTRKLLTYATTAQCAFREAEEANLSGVYQVLSDPERFDALLADGADSTILGGELAGLAADIASLKAANEKQFESFREGALQSLQAFGPSGYLAASTSHCDFRFRDLKREKTTIFMVCDPSRMDVFAPWIGTLTWAALKELVREENTIPVQCLFDEFTNYVLTGLPNTLTALGGSGVRCWLVVQELEEVIRVYGREALATILSQTDVKQFFGVASFETAYLVSKMLGQTTISTESFSMGQDLAETPTANRSKAPRDLLTPDEVRRLPDDEQIIFARNLLPMRALKAGYHEIAPWRDQVAPNPMFGGKRFLGKVKLKISGSKAIATRAGTRKPKRENSRRGHALAALLSDLIPGPFVFALAVCAFVVWQFGLPYLRMEYAYRGSRDAPTYVWCAYWGLPVVSESFVLQSSGECPIIIWKKIGESAQ